MSVRPYVIVFIFSLVFFICVLSNNVLEQQSYNSQNRTLDVNHKINSKV